MFIVFATPNSNTGQLVQLRKDEVDHFVEKLTNAGQIFTVSEDIAVAIVDFGKIAGWKDEVIPPLYATECSIDA